MKKNKRFPTKYKPPKSMYHWHLGFPYSVDGEKQVFPTIEILEKHPDLLKRPFNSREEANEFLKENNIQNLSPYECRESECKYSKNEKDNSR